MKNLTRKELKKDESFIRNCWNYNNSNYGFDTFFKGSFYTVNQVKWGLKIKIWQDGNNDLDFSILDEN